MHLPSLPSIYHPSISHQQAKWRIASSIAVPQGPSIYYSSCLGPLLKYMWTVSSCLIRTRQGELRHLDPNSSMEGSRHRGRAVHILTCLEKALRDVHFQMSSLIKNWTSDRGDLQIHWVSLTLQHQNGLLMDNHAHYFSYPTQDIVGGHQPFCRFSLPL